MHRTAEMLMLTISDQDPQMDYQVVSEIQNQGLIRVHLQSGVLRMVYQQTTTEIRDTHHRIIRQTGPIIQLLRAVEHIIHQPVQLIIRQRVQEI